MTLHFVLDAGILIASALLAGRLAYLAVGAYFGAL